MDLDLFSESTICFVKFFCLIPGPVSPDADGETSTKNTINVYYIVITVTRDNMKYDER